MLSLASFKFDKCWENVALMIAGTKSQFHFFFSSVNKVKESLFFYSKKRTKPSILISCGFYCVVAVDYYRLLIIHKFVWVRSHLLRLLLRILLKFVIWKGGVRCEFLSVESILCCFISNLDGYLWLNRVFLFCFLLMAIFSMANGAVVHETLWSAALGLNPSTWTAYSTL